MFKQNLRYLLFAMFIIVGYGHIYYVGFRDAKAAVTAEYEERDRRSKHFNQVMGWCEFVKSVNEKEHCGVDMTLNPDRDFQVILEAYRDKAEKHRIEAEQCQKTLGD